MLGYYFCENCGETHCEWFHGEKMMVCERCFSKRSVRYNELVKWAPSHPTVLLPYGISEEMQKEIRESVKCNPMDVRRVLNSTTGEVRGFIARNLDIYIKFAYFGFRKPEEVRFDLSGRADSDHRESNCLLDMS